MRSVQELLLLLDVSLRDAVGTAKSRVCLGVLGFPSTTTLGEEVGGWGGGGGGVFY